MDADRRPTEAELFAEILSRMDGKQQGGQSGTAQDVGKQSAIQSINLIELFYYLLSKLHLILLGMILGAVLLGSYAAHRITPV